MRFLGAKLKDRGWWVSIEFESARHNRKKSFPRVMSRLTKGDCYNLYFDDGKAVTRGIFGRRTEHIKLLSELFLLTKDWADVDVHLEGERLNDTRRHLLGKMLACARGNPPCRDDNPKRRLSFLGCHLKDVRVGLINFFPSLYSGEPYWFSFFKQDESSRSHFTLDWLKLRNNVKKSTICPQFPSSTWNVIASLPNRIDFNRLSDIDMWVWARSVPWAKEKKHFPTVLPGHMERYNKWLLNLLDHPLQEPKEHDAI